MAKLGDAEINLKINPDLSDEAKAFLREEVRKLLEEEKDKLYQEFVKRLQCEARLASSLPSWARMETK